MTRRLIRVRAHDDGIDRWRHAEAAPDPRLAGFVDHYSCWQETTASFTTRRELASTDGVFIVNLGAPLEIVDARGDVHRLRAGEGFAGGMAQATSLSRSTGAMHGVHVFLPIDRLSRLLSLPLAELAERVVPLDRVLGTDADILGARLLEARGDEACFAVLDEFITARLTHIECTENRLSRALHLLAQPVIRPVVCTAGSLGWSRKRLAVRFRDATGMLPRDYVRLARFDRFTRAIRATPEADLAMLAADAGYADQAHLTRDTQRLSAMTPGALRARLIPASGGVRDD